MEGDVRGGASGGDSLFGFGPRGLPTDRPMWSDESGLKECTKGDTQPPSPQWSWVGRRS